MNQYNNTQPHGKLVRHNCSNPDGLVFPPGQRPYKTKLCNNYESSNACPRGISCTYAHKQTELICKFCGYNYYTRNSDGTNELNTPYVANMNNQQPAASQFNKKQLYQLNQRSMSNPTDNDKQDIVNSNSNNHSSTHRNTATGSSTPYKVNSFYRSNQWSPGVASPAVLSRQTTKSDTVNTRATPSRSRAFSESITFTDDHMQRRFSNATSIFHDIHYIQSQQINIEYSELIADDIIQPDEHVLRYELKPEVDENGINMINNNCIDLPDILYCGNSESADELINQFILTDNNNNHHQSTNNIAITVWRSSNDNDSDSNIQQQLIAICYRHIIIVIDTDTTKSLPRSLMDILQSTQYIKTLTNTVYNELIIDHSIRCNNVVDINATVQLLCNSHITYDSLQLFDKYLHIKLNRPNGDNNNAATATGHVLQYIASEAYLISSLCTVLQTKILVSSRR